MKALVIFFVALALGTANPIGPTTIFGPSREDRIKTAIDNNVQWLLRGIRNGTLEGLDLPRAVVALFLAEPGFFSPGHEIGQELRNKIRTALTELIRQQRIQIQDEGRYTWTGPLFSSTPPSFIPSVELALYVQALLVSCVDPYDFLGYDLTDDLYKSILRHDCDYGGRHTNCTVPSPAMLALCNARAASKISTDMLGIDAINAYGGISSSMPLTDEEAFLTMTFGCLGSSNYPYPKDIPSEDIRLRHPLPSSGYRHYPFNQTVEDFQEMMKTDGDPMGNTTSLFGIAAAMQNLMYNHHLRVSDLPSAVDFLLRSQDEDGSWGQSTLNSFFVLPVLSNKNFLDITSDHCPEESGNKTLVAKGGVDITILSDDSSVWSSSDHRDTSLYDTLTRFPFISYNAIYYNGTDGKPYLHSFQNKENNPETGYFWVTYEQTRWPKESFTLLTQSHADIQLKRSSRYLLWYRRKTEEEIQNDQNQRIKMAIDNNVQWLLSGIRNGTLEGPDLPRAVVALFLAEPGFFSAGHKIGQELRDKIETALTELIRQGEIQSESRWTRTQPLLPMTAPSFIPSVELALFLQALLVSCVDPYDFLGYDLTDGLYKSVLRHHCDRREMDKVDCTFPSPAMLALCNARANSEISMENFMTDAITAYGGMSSSTRLTDEEAFLTMTFGCRESSIYPYPSDLPYDIRLRHPLSSFGYRYYPSNLTVEDFKEMIKPDADLMGNTTSVFVIAAAMQNLMYNHHLRVSDLPSAVDSLLKSQDEDGSWGQSALNSFFVLPVLSNKNFVNISSDHCPEGSENKTLVAKGGVSITILNDDSSVWSSSDHRDTSLYDTLTRFTFISDNAMYYNGTDGKPYLHSFQNKANNPETGYFWLTYEQTRWPKESFTLLLQSHADIQLKRSSRYILWYRKIIEEETQNDENETEAVPQMES